MTELKLIETAQIQSGRQFAPRRHDSGNDALDGVVRRFRWLGTSHNFDDVAVLLTRVTKSGTVQPSIMFASFEPEFMQALTGAGNLGACSLFGQLEVSTAPFGWDVGVEININGKFSANQNIADEGFDELLDAFGIGGGYCVPVHDPAGNRAVVIYFGARPESERQYPSLVLATIQLFDELGGLPQIKPSNLSDRAIGLLQQIADGKRISELASALGYSEHTIYHYLQNVKKNLGAKSIEHAIAKAIRYGFVS